MNKEKNEAEVLIEYLAQLRSNISVGEINGIIEVLKVINFKLQNEKSVQNQGSEKHDSPSESGVQEHQKGSKKKQDSDKKK